MPWDQVDTEALFLACAAGENADAWAEFSRRFGVLVERTAYNVARAYSRPTAELLDDLAQECYTRICADKCKVLRVFRSTRPDSEFGYIKVVAKNACLDYFRKRSNNRRDISLPDAPEPVATNQSVDRKLLLSDVEKCLERVVDGPNRVRDRSVFKLYYQRGLTALEISQVPAIGLSREGVESLLGRTVRALRTCLGVGAFA